MTATTTSPTPPRGTDDTVHVLVVDDHPLVREGLERVVSAQPPYRVVGAVDSIEAAVALDLERVDLCTLDLSLPGVSGLEGIADLQARWPGVRVLVVSMHPEESHAPACLQRGADGFVSKSAPPEVIRSALSSLAAGGQFFSPTSLAAISTGVSAAPVLSPREFEVLRMLADGERITDIAARLNLSIKTASAHKMRLQRKLGASNTAQIVVIARARGVLT